MIKGAALLGLGFSLGYIKALSDQEAVREAARAFVNFLNDLALQEEIARKQAADEKAEGGVVDATADEITEPEETPQGETP